jgi:hypothetical protein
MSKASERVDEAVKAGEDKAEIERLAKLDEVAYMRARKEAAEKLGIDVGDLNKLVNDKRKAFATVDDAADEAAAEEKTKQADVLIELATKSAKLFHTPDDVAYADIEINGHRETWPVRRRGFKQWLGPRRQGRSLHTSSAYPRCPRRPPPSHLQSSRFKIGA